MSEFSLDKLRSSVQKFQDTRRDTGGEWPQCTFFPEGNHKLRFLVDPVNEPYCEFYSYGYFARGIRDPKDDTGVPEGFKNELEEIFENELKPLQKWSYGSKNNFLVYIWLYETDSPSDNWQPNNLYVAICNNKFAESYVTFLSTLAKDAPEEILKSLKPTSTGVILSVSFKGGSQGGCSIGAAFPTKMADPIDLTGKPYIPLDLAYIRPGFKQDKYDALVKKYREDANKFKAIAGANTTTLTDSIPKADGTAAMVKTEEAPKDSTTVDSPTTTESTTQSTAGTVEEVKVDTNDVWAKFRS